ncbi:hypothetical protein PV10_03676 [Exophiala mesophila]|uniref:Major facilitator superfamily (MFS) profile domain-containing protein n=1 Tax=Exophiala mesophila TaxID=212818 RepID=A0A0D1ZZY2_EXOME|nr:uncharacterized protein PV10_03676 [Exophiala mesophila]KIV92368.1 hypothetical protein PV10_03676 [Exophiala mesophila]
MSDTEMKRTSVTAKKTSTEHVDYPSSEHQAVEQPKLTWRMIFLGIYVGMAGWMYNFDLGYSGVVLLMNPFKQAFGSYGPILTSNGEIVNGYSLTDLQQSLVSITVLFIGLGSALASVFGQYTGRRGTIQAAGGLHNYRRWRWWGIFLGFFAWGLAVGQLTANGVCMATAKYTTYLAWQTPIICHIPLAITYGVLTFAFPESPRWLLTKGRDDAARKSFAIYYGKPVDDPVVSYQLNEVVRHLELERRTDSARFWDILRGVNARRTLASAIIALGIAASGSRFITTYAVIFFAGIGLGNPYLINVLLAASASGGVILVPWLVEYKGRCFVLLFGYGLLGTYMLIIGAVGSGFGQSNNTAQLILIVFPCLWNFTYGLILRTRLSTGSAEQHSLRLRTYGQAFVIALYEVVAFVVSFSIPYMISPNYGNMGLNVGYFFAGLSALIWVGSVFFVPETGQISLEQIDDLYMSGTSPWKTSLKKNKKIALESGHLLM